MGAKEKEIEDFKNFLENKEYQNEEDKLLPKSDTDVDDDVIDSGDEDDRDEHCMSKEMEEFCLHSMRMYTNVHLWHLQTDSYAQHEALEAYYGELFELTDAFIEAAIANHGEIRPNTTFSLEILPIEEMLEEIKAFKDLIVQTKDICHEDGMHNIMDDMLSESDSVIYKLENLK